MWVNRVEFITYLYTTDRIRLCSPFKAFLAIFECLRNAANRNLVVRSNIGSSLMLAVSRSAGKPTNELVATTGHRMTHI